MVKMTTSDHLKYLKVAVEVTRNYQSAAGHGPMIENIYRTLCKVHQQIPEDGEAAPESQGESPA
jgi:hypothetical protein